MSEAENEQDDEPETRELSEDELDDVAGGSHIRYDGGNAQP